MTDPSLQPAYLRWRSDNRIAGALVTASLSITADALALIFGLNTARGSLTYAAVLLSGAVLGGLLMTHNRFAVPLAKPLLLLLAGATLAARSVGTLQGTASLVCCAAGALLALGFIIIARGERWNAFMQDVRTGEDTPRAAIRNSQLDR